MNKNRLKINFWNRTRPLQTEEGLILAFQLARSLKISGDYYEFGVWRGESMAFACELGRDFPEIISYVGFDAWQGLEHAEGTWEKGEYYSEKDKAEQALKDYDHSLIDGWFKDTLKDFTPVRQIAIAHIDCDTYTATKQVLAFLEKNVTRCVLLFDDYYMNFGESERKAVNEWMKKSKLNIIPHKDYGVNGKCFIVKR